MLQGKPELPQCLNNLPFNASHACLACPVRYVAEYGFSALVGAGWECIAYIVSGMAVITT